MSPVLVVMMAKNQKEWDLDGRQYADPARGKPSIRISNPWLLHAVQIRRDIKGGL